MTTLNMLPFHGYADLFPIATSAGASLHFIRRHTVTQERTLAYRFYSHSHPYATELVRRLISGRVRGLQAADTDYVVDKEQLRPISGSTKVKLLDPFKVSDDKKFPAGYPLNVPDGVQLRLPTNEVVTLPGIIPLQEFRALTFPNPVPNAPPLKVVRGTVLTLAAQADLILADGLPQTFPAGTRLAFGGSLPLPTLYETFFTGRYTPSKVVEQPYPVKELDFTSSGAYSVYNWELFFHVPLTIAINLSKSQRYAEAQSWFHLLFDPTDDSNGSTPERFWKVKPFQSTEVRRIEEILINLSTNADPQLRDDTNLSIEAWRDAPFRPHLVARFRQSAYMFKTVMAYLDNLRDWGDSLFAQDTGETINEAMQVYVLMANILGERPQQIPPKGTLAKQSYSQLRSDLSKFGDVLRAVETNVVSDFASQPTQAGDVSQVSILTGIGKALYFGVPRNDKLLAYWDTVADRLFKIRNSLNLQGVFRQLPLFEPPIDPALLARAVAAGLDIGAVMSGLNQPLPLVRFPILLQKATEICQEVKSLGANLLTTIEKEDNEALAVLRARHETKVLTQAEALKFAQWQEAIKGREGLLQSLDNAAERYRYFEQQLGKKPEEIKIPMLDALDVKQLEELKETFTTIDPKPPGLRPLNFDLAGDLSGDVAGRMLNRFEAEEMDKMGTARDIQDTVKVLTLAAKGLTLIPDFGVKLHFWGLGGDLVLGGTKLSKASEYASDVAMAIADRLSYESGRAGRVGAFARRELDWGSQSNAAAGEIALILKQLRAAQIREYAAHRDWQNHKKQIEFAQEVEAFLNAEGANKAGKKANQALYAWMKREVRGLYNRSFQFAFEVAKKTERGLQHELGDTQITFIQPAYQDGKEGLLAGERLHLDLKRMEMAYLEQNRREYELTKHVSLLQTDPSALLMLRRGGSCTLSVPEELFDMDGPGHYFRRIKSVAVTIPCVSGPYTSINCTLRLRRSSIRTSSQLDGDTYARAGSEDPRFNDYSGSTQAIVTSHAQNDGGLFETNLRDDRYLPFEGSGAISDWQIDLPKGVRQFDYDTITDVILHVRYTAREGGKLLGDKATANVTDRIGDAAGVRAVRLFSVRNEFPTAWAAFKKSPPPGGPDGDAPLTIDLKPEHYPIWSKDRLGNPAKGVELFARTSKNAVSVSDRGGRTDKLSEQPAEGLRAGHLKKIQNPAPTGPLTLLFDDLSMTDLWLAVTWA